MCLFTYDGPEHSRKKELDLDTQQIRIETYLLRTCTCHIVNRI